MKQFFFLICFFMTTLVMGQSKNFCGEKTTKGTACQLTVKVAGDKCRFHSLDTPRCGQSTSKNEPCKMVVKTKGEVCWRHKPKN